jgi:superfamily II DNA or RNA helicase
MVKLAAAAEVESKESSVQVLVLCHTRELAFRLLTSTNASAVFAFHQDGRLYGGVNIRPKDIWPTTVPSLSSNGRILPWRDKGL